MKYKIRQRSTYMVTDATSYHTIDSKEFIDCTPKYEGASQKAFVSYLDTNFRDEKTILANEDVLSKYTVDTLYSLFIMPELKPLNSTKDIDEHPLLEISECKPKTAKIFIM